MRDASGIVVGVSFEGSGGVQVQSRQIRSGDVVAQRFGHERVREAEAIRAGHGQHPQRERGSNPRRELGNTEHSRGNRPAELPPEHRAGSERLPRLRRQARDALANDGAHAGQRGQRQPPDRFLRRHELLDEQRIALAELEHSSSVRALADEPDHVTDAEP